MAALAAGQYTVATDGTHIATDGVKRYVALLTQTGTDAPVATVLTNTLSGPIVWTYNDVGSYTGTLTGAFTADKTLTCSGVTRTGRFWELSRETVNSVTLTAITAGGDPVELNATISAEIRVFP